MIAARHCHLLFSVLFLLCANNSVAQRLKPVRDFGIWAGVAVEKKFCNNYKVEVEQQLRTWQNSTRLDDYFLDIGLKYTINKYFRIGAGVRYVYDTKRSKETENNWRYHLDLEYKTPAYKKLKLRYRLRYQKEYINLFENYDDEREFNSVFRNRIILEWEYSKANEPFVSAEIFRLMETYRRPYFSKLRFELGNNNKMHLGEVNYAIGWEKELKSRHPYSFFYAKLVYTLKL